jgi:PAS domain-containing protein
MKNLRVTNLNLLRKQAEDKLAGESMKSESDLSEIDILKINHELQVHQIELEMQNDELIYSKERTDEIAEKYIDLYNFAPIGYFTLSREGIINEVNEFGSKLIGVGPDQLVNCNFDYFIIDEDKRNFVIFLEKVFESKLNETCMVSMPINQNIKKHILLTGNITKKGNFCFIAALDISERLKLEKETNELQQFNSYFIGRELRMIELKKEINDLLQKEGLEKKYPVS